MASRRRSCGGKDGAGHPSAAGHRAPVNSAELDLATVQAVMTIQHHWQRYLIQKRLRDAGPANTAVLSVMAQQRSSRMARAGAGGAQPAEDDWSGRIERYAKASLSIL